MKLALAGIKKRLKPRTTLAITIESGRIAVDLLRREADRTRVAQSFVVAMGAESVVADSAKAGQALAAQLDAAGIHERRCVVCIPPGWALSTSTEVPGIGAGDLRGWLELRAERELPIPVSDLRLAHCTYSLTDGRQRATLVAVPLKRMAAIERMLHAAGCRAVSISLGLDQCVPRSEQPAALHFLANGTHVDLVISAGGGIAALRSLAGAVGEDADMFDPASFSREVRITLGQLPATLRQQVNEAHFGGAPHSAEVLCREIQPHLQRMGIESLVTAPGAKTHPGAAIAAAAHHLREEAVAFEFVAPRVNRWEAMFQKLDSRRRRWIASAALALVVLPMLAFLVRSHIETGLDSEWQGMRKKVAELEKLQQQIRQFRPWFDPAPHSVQILEGLIGAFPESGEVWAKSIQIAGESKIVCSGFARNQAALMVMMDRLRARPDVAGLQIQQVRGENPVQFAVTYKWEAKNAN